MTEIINKIICENDKTDYFVTAWIGILTLSTGDLTYINAGHEYPALKKKNGDFRLVETDNFPPFAVYDDLEFEEMHITLEDGDSLFLYTDGVPDAKNEKDERFGTDRMLMALNAEKDNTPEAIINGTKAAISRFMGSADVFDDITMLCLHYYSQNGKGDTIQ